MDLSPPHSHASSRTLDTGTLNTEASSETVTGTTTQRQDQQQNDVYIRKVPGVRKAQLVSADLALLPQPSYTQLIVNKIPFLKWFSGSMIGNEVPRTDAGDFDWDRASLYWKLIWWLDSKTNLFGGEICGSADRDD